MIGSATAQSLTVNVGWIVMIVCGTSGAVVSFTMQLKPESIAKYLVPNPSIFSLHFSTSAAGPCNSIWSSVAADSSSFPTSAPMFSRCASEAAASTYASRQNSLSSLRVQP